MIRLLKYEKCSKLTRPVLGTVLLPEEPVKSIEDKKDE